MFFDDGDIIERPFPPRETSSSSTTIFRNAFFECTVIRSVPYPDPNNGQDSPDPKTQWFCMEETNDRTMYRLKGDVEAYFDNYIINRNLRLQIPLDSIQVSDKSISIVDLDADYDRSSIKVIQGSKRLSRTLFDMSIMNGRYHSYCEDTYFKGTYKVLIIRVEDKHGNSVNQSEDKLYDDFFQDENNLVSVDICYCKFVYTRINHCIPFPHLL